MSLKFYANEDTSVKYVLGGFESGHVVLWDSRFPSKLLSKFKACDEAG